MVLELTNNQRKTIREFYLINDLYCDRLNKAEGLRIKEKENNDNEAQKEKSGIIDSLQEHRSNITQLKNRVEKLNLTVDWSPNIFRSLPKKGDLSSRECYYQSINQAKIKIGLLDKSFSRYVEYLAGAKKRSRDKSINTCILVVFIPIMILFFSIVISENTSRNQQDTKNTMVAMTSQAETTATAAEVALRTTVFNTRLTIQSIQPVNNVDVDSDYLAYVGNVDFSLVSVERGDNSTLFHFSLWNHNSESFFEIYDNGVSYIMSPDGTKYGSSDWHSVSSSAGEREEFIIPFNLTASSGTTYRLFIFNYTVTNRMSSPNIQWQPLDVTLH